jgi:hypothetical protein
MFFLKYESEKKAMTRGVHNENKLQYVASVGSG